MSITGKFVWHELATKDPDAALQFYGELFGWSGTLFCLWFLGAATAQLAAPTLTIWVIGLVAQALLSIALVVQQQLTDL